MSVFNYLFIVIGISFIYYAVFLFYKGKVPVKLLEEALRLENAGNYEAAINNYQIILEEVKKSRFHSDTLVRNINNKLKVLRTVINYHSNFQYPARTSTFLK